MKLRMVLATLRTRPRKHSNIVWNVFSSRNIQSERAVLRDKAGTVCQSVLLETLIPDRRCQPAVKAVSYSDSY
jgi:hypothetical protein